MDNNRNTKDRYISRIKGITPGKTIVLYDNKEKSLQVYSPKEDDPYLKNNIKT